MGGRSRTASRSRRRCGSGRRTSSRRSARDGGRPRGQRCHRQERRDPTEQVHRRSSRFGEKPAAFRCFPRPAGRTVAVAEPRRCILTLRRDPLRCQATRPRREIPLRTWPGSVSSTSSRQRQPLKFRYKPDLRTRIAIDGGWPGPRPERGGTLCGWGSWVTVIGLLRRPAQEARPSSAVRTTQLCPRATSASCLRRSASCPSRTFSGGADRCAGRGPASGSSGGCSAQFAAAARRCL
jgi:hypothetical protein